MFSKSDKQIKHSSFVFFQSAQAGLIPDKDDLVDNLHLLFDLDTDTCVDVDETTLVKGFLRINIVVPQLIEGGLVRVHFNQTTVCGMRKVSLNLFNQ